MVGPKKHWFVHPTASNAAKLEFAKPPDLCILWKKRRDVCILWKNDAARNSDTLGNRFARVPRTHLTTRAHWLQYDLLALATNSATFQIIGLFEIYITTARGRISAKCCNEIFYTKIF